MEHFDENEIDNEETTKLTQCLACGFVLLGADRFCRKCGVSQAQIAVLSTSQNGSCLAECFSSDWLPPLWSKSYRPVSGPLIDAVTHGVRTIGTQQLLIRSVRALVLALVSVPIWLLIILLSPLEAYLVAKTISRQV